MTDRDALDGRSYSRLYSWDDGPLPTGKDRLKNSKNGCE